MNATKPRALQHGDTISVVVPAGPVNRERIDRALARLHERGFRTKTYGDIYRAQGYLAGEDAMRADELMAAFADPDTTAVWCARGGYGVVRLLEQIDFEVIRGHPKVFIGFSDITALHIAFNQRACLITFHGPNLQDGFGKAENMPAANEAALWQAMLPDEQRQAQTGYEFDLTEFKPGGLRTITPGVANGPLTGGNLAVLCGTLGTPFEIDSAGRILFIEDVSEPLYRIDRYLAQLALAGKLQAAAGVLVGNFSYEEADKAEQESDVFALLNDYFGRLDNPVLSGFPAGHSQYNLTLPMNARVELDATNARVKVLENLVRLD